MFNIGNMRRPESNDITSYTVRMIGLFAPAIEQFSYYIRNIKITINPHLLGNTPGCNWYCSSNLTNDFSRGYATLDEAKNEMNTSGGINNIQAIIPMSNKEAGDPKSLGQSWTLPLGKIGSMFFKDEHLSELKEMCEKLDPMCG